MACFAIIFLLSWPIPLVLLIGELVVNGLYLPRSFRLADMMIAVGLVGSVLSVYRGWGAVAFVTIASLTWFAVAGTRTRFARWGCIVSGAWLTLSLVALLTAVPPARAAAQKMSSAGRLKQIALALHNYHDTHGTFPPAYLADENGVPQHSWRVLLLPYIEQSALHQQYRFDEPWNGPNNRKLLPLMPYAYQEPSTSAGKWTAEFRTPYVTIVDPDGAMPGDIPRRLSDFSREEAANTIMVVESPGEPPLWMEPSDLETEEAIRLFAEHYPGTFGGHRITGVVRDVGAGWQAATVDGQIEWIDWGTPAETWRGLIRRQAGTGQSEESIPYRTNAGRSFYRSRTAGLAVYSLFFALAMASAWRVSARSAEASEDLPAASEDCRAIVLNRSGPTRTV